MLILINFKNILRQMFTANKITFLYLAFLLFLASTTNRFLLYANAYISF